MFDPTLFPPEEDDVAGFAMADRTTIFDPPDTAIFDYVEPHKMYVLVRRDLKPGLRCAQGMHAVAEVCLQYPEKAWEWNKSGNYMIVLEVADLDSLLEWNSRIAATSFLAGYAWTEPDLDDEMTAIVVLPRPHENVYFNSLPLAYKETWLDRLVRWTGSR